MPEIDRDVRILDSIQRQAVGIWFWWEESSGEVERTGAVCLKEAEVVLKKNPAVEHPPVGDRVRN